MFAGFKDMTADNKWFDEMESKIPKGKVRTRFAPSPTGYMHVGNLRTALYTYLIARRGGGTFILRIEDTDQGRLVEGAVDVIYETMKKCGLEHDEGPDVGGPVGPYVQTERRGYYKKYAERLIELGGAYRCFCQREETEGGEAFSKYDGRCARLSPEEIDAKLKVGVPYVIRQKIPREGATTITDAVFGEIKTPNDSLDDNVLIKTDGLPTYNFANVIDDHLMGITHVVRGSEYLSSAPKYNLLYKSFGWEIPVYIHCPPVMRDAQHKMSKRHGDPSYEDLIKAGYISEAIVNYVALLGWSPGGEREIYTLSELAQIFDIKGISKSPAIFDIEKLTFFNSEYLRALEPSVFAVFAEPYIRQAITKPETDVAEVAALLQQRCEKLTDIPEKLDFFESLPEYDISLYEHKKSKTDKTISLQMLRTVLPVLESIESWTQSAVHQTLMGLAEKLEIKNATLLWPIRIAAAGKAVTPGGAVEICHILGREETLRRINIGIRKLSGGKL